MNPLDLRAKRSAMSAEDSDRNPGIKSLLRYYRSQFKIPENVDYYSSEDYKIAERKFLKFALVGHRANDTDRE